MPETSSGPARGQRPGEYAAAALADHRHALAGRLREPLEPLLQPRAGDLGAVDVRADPGALRALAGARSQRVIVASEPSPAMKPGISSTGRARRRRAPRRRARPSCGAGRPTPVRSASRARAVGGDLRKAGPHGKRFLPGWRVSAIFSVSSRTNPARRIAGQRCEYPREHARRHDPRRLDRRRGPPGSGAPDGRAARPRPRRRPQRRRHPPARRRLSGAARLAARHPRPRAGRRGRRARPPASPASSPAIASWRSSAAAARPSSRVVHERAAMPVPDELDWTAAGGVPEAFTTAHDALFTQAGWPSASGCSSTAPPAASAWPRVQLGAMAGARVTATVRDAAAREQIAALGVNAIEPEGFDEYGPFDVSSSWSARRTWPRTSSRWPTGGRICMIGVGAGAKAEINLHELMVKRGRGSTARRCARGRSRTRRPPRGWSSSRCCRASPPATSSCRSPRRSRSTTSPTPTSASRRARKLGKIVLEI